MQDVLLFIPNLVGYIRIALLLITVALGEHRPLIGLLLFVANFAFDGLDGILARALHQVCPCHHFRQPNARGITRTVHANGSVTDSMLGQESAFGAWLDVVIDNVSRGALWCWAVEGPLAIIPIAVEFLTFAATHKARKIPSSDCSFSI